MQSQHKPVLIFAQSGRFLAQSATQAGYFVWVADCFGDQDTLSIADRWLKIPPFSIQNNDAILAIFSELSRGENCDLICGSGIEGYYSLLDKLPDNIQLIGNSTTTIQTIKTPFLFFDLLDQLGLPYPITQFEQPKNSKGWLVKSASGLGGNHIKSLTSTTLIPEHYFQKRVDGISGSILFLANGKDAQLISINKQFMTDNEDCPFRLLGIESPLNLIDTHQQQLTQAIEEITKATGLIGCNSLDFMISDQNECLVLEVNPRPSASMELVDDTVNLFQLHYHACQGILPTKPIQPSSIQASLRYLYAEIDCTVPDDMDWPNSCHDIPNGGFFIKKNEPICTSIVKETSAQSVDKLHEAIEQRVVQQLIEFNN